MSSEALRVTLIEIQDFLAPTLDTYEQMLYHYLFRHTHLEGKTEVTVGIRTIQTRVGFGIGKFGSPPSDVVVTKKLRKLEAKKCIQILNRSAKGTQIRVFLPAEIPGILPKESDEQSGVPLEELDFFNDNERRLLILQRENFQCFYCLKKITEDNFTIDHVLAQAEQGTHAYTNVVACCFNCNTTKQGRLAEDFLRSLYREGLLNNKEHQSGLSKLNELRRGELKPDMGTAI